MFQLTDTIYAAIIGAISALVTILIKDFALVRWHKQRDKSATEKEVLRLYVGPLASACEKLVWRFSEIFLGSRHHFLKAATLPLVFNEYKRQSTLFRIASLLGWMRAMQLELNALPKGGRGFSEGVGNAIEAVRRALADGPEVELLRLRRLCELWTLGSAPEAKEAALAADLERRLYAEAGDQLRHDSRYLQQLERPAKIRICRILADFLCGSLGRAALPQAVLEETVETAIVGMSYREALIYRDWQDAIGDLMLVRDEDSERRYALVGFADFSDLLDQSTLWMEVFRESIVDIDFEAVDLTDFRAKQLSALSAAVAEITIALAQTEHRDLVPRETLDQAGRLLAHHKKHHEVSDGG